MFMFLPFFKMSFKSDPFLSQVFRSAPSAVGEGPAWEQGDEGGLKDAFLE